MQAPETNHIYTISNTILVNYTAGLPLSLWVYASRVDLGSDGATVGEPASLTGILPSWFSPTSVTEATASLVITRIVQT